MRTLVSSRRNLFPIFVILLHTAGIALRWLWILSGRFPFNSDEAIVGLMARHILAGELPTFFYGQSYMGSLDAFWVSVFFRLFGSTINILRISQTILWIILIISIFFMCKEVFRSIRSAWIALFFLAFPPVNLLLYSTVTLGGYLEAMIIGVTVMNLAHQVYRIPGSHILRILAIGLVSGFGVWVFGFSLIFTLPASLFTFWAIARKKLHPNQIVSRIAFFVAGGIIGSLPWWIYAIQNGFSNLITELAGSAIAVEQGSVLSKVATHLFSFIFIGLPAALGLRPPWTIEWLVLPLIPFVLIGWIWVLWEGRTQSNRPARLFMYLPLGLLLIVFVFTPFGVDPSGRYFLPFNVLLPVLAGGIYLQLQGKMRKTFILWMVLVLVFQIAGTFQSEKNSQTGMTTQFAPNTEIDHSLLVEVGKFLKANNETRGYTTYWISYPLAFTSDEELIFTPRLPYHQDFRYTTRDDRYLPYQMEVMKSEKIALVTYGFQDLDQQIRSILTKKEISWNEQKIGEYQIFYNLSGKIEADDLLFQVK